MTNEELRARIAALKTSGDCCQLAADLPHEIEQNCEGTPAETFIAGWVNAQDCIDEGSIAYGDDEEYLRVCLHEYRDMGHDRPTEPVMCRDYRGQLVKAPADLPTVIVSVNDRRIVWSRNSVRHQVRYGLEVKQFKSAHAAADDLSDAIRHHAECEGAFS